MIKLWFKLWAKVERLLFPRCEMHGCDGTGRYLLLATLQNVCEDHAGRVDNG